MKISKEVKYEIINHMPTRPPEAGGIIGGKNGKIFLWKYDCGQQQRGCMYSPKVNYLNEIIEVWRKQGYAFMGIVHVHFGGARGLSKGDEKYINIIMKAMPISVGQLYFPIVVQPEREMYCYKAVRSFRGKIKIRKEKIKIID